MSNEKKHTPGPWSPKYIYGAMRHIERNVDDDAFLSKEGQEEICGRWDEESGTEVKPIFNIPSCRTNPADVALIAAAPPMADILDRIIEVYDAGADISFLIEEARAIFDKVNSPPARGES